MGAQRGALRATDVPARRVAHVACATQAPQRSHPQARRCGTHCILALCQRALYSCLTLRVDPVRCARDGCRLQLGLPMLSRPPLVMRHRTIGRAGRLRDRHIRLCPFHCLRISRGVGLVARRGSRAARPLQRSRTTASGEQRGCKYFSVLGSRRHAHGRRQPVRRRRRRLRGHCEHNACRLCHHAWEHAIGPASTH